MRTCDWSEVKDGEFFIATETMNEGFRMSLGYYAALILQRVGTGITIWQTAQKPYSTYVVYAYDKNFKLKNQAGAKLLTPGCQKVICYASWEDIPLFQRISLGISRVNNATGTDPEIFVVKGENKTLMPAFDFLPTQKAQAKIYYNHFGLSQTHAYRDGFAAECAVVSGGCHGSLVSQIRAGLVAVLDAARKKDISAKLTLKNTFVVPKTTMKRATDEDVAFGCSPSMNIYEDVPPLEANPRDFPMRFAGGHIHFGIGSLAPLRVKENAYNIVAGCDLFAGIPAVAMFEAIDTPIRRQMYGKAGEYRLPKHGLEYRTLSNGWLAAPALAHLVLNLTRIGAMMGYNKKNDVLGVSEEQAREVINFCDVKTARQIISKHYDLFAILLRKDGVYQAADTESKRAFRGIIEGGVPALFKDYQNVEKNWSLGGQFASHSDNDAATWGAYCKTVGMKMT